jgi:hypothetical protein
MHNHSGTHCNDPLEFVNLAIKKCKFSIHRLAVYYFFVKCEDNSRIDDQFQPFMSDELKGTSIDLVAPSTVSTSNKRKNQNKFEVTEAGHGIKLIVDVLTS